MPNLLNQDFEGVGGMFINYYCMLGSIEYTVEITVTAITPTRSPTPTIMVGSIIPISRA